MNTQVPTLAAALAHAELLHDRDQLLGCISAMGKRIDTALQGERPVFITVMNGALVFAGHLALAKARVAVSRRANNASALS